MVIFIQFFKVITFSIDIVLFTTKKKDVNKLILSMIFCDFDDST
jgi:hypothetical protein